MTSTFAAAPARPVRIAVSYVMDAANVSCAYSDEVHALATNMARAIMGAGTDVQAWLIDAQRLPMSADELMSRVDGYAVMGGVDVDPALYSDDADVIAGADAGDLNRVADDNEIALARAARAAGLPVLAVCRGMQLVNVALGGTLVPDLGSGTMHNTRPTRDEFTGHDVRLAPGSRLRAIYGEPEVAVRSAHHQAVDRAAEGLRVTASATDGVIEGYEEADGPWLVGVQWHPEASDADAAHLNLLAGALVEAARKKP